MAYTILNATDDLTGILHGTNVDKVTNLSSLFQRGGRNVLAKLDPIETIRIQNLTNALHEDIFDYALPSDVKGDGIIDIRPQVNRTEFDNFSQFSSEPFDLSKHLSGGRNRIQIKYDDGIKSIRIAKTISPRPIAIHQMDSITNNGTWAVGGDATNLTQDKITFVFGNASLNFDMNASGSAAHIENSTMSQVDLTDHDEVSSLFINIYLPDPSIITSVNLRWGNSATVHWNRTVTTAHDATAFRTGWNILRFDWDGATQTGNVDPSVIDTLRVTVNYDGTAETDIRVDKITSSLGKIFEIEYYSKFIFRTSAGVFQETTSDDSDIINLDTESYNIFLFEVAEMLAQQIQGSDSTFDVNYFSKKLHGDNREKGLYRIYRDEHPSRRIKMQGEYYRFNRSIKGRASLNR